MDSHLLVRLLGNGVYSQEKVRRSCWLPAWRAWGQCSLQTKNSLGFSFMCVSPELGRFIASYWIFTFGSLTLLDIIASGLIYQSQINLSRWYLDCEKRKKWQHYSNVYDLKHTRLDLVLKDSSPDETPLYKRDWMNMRKRDVRMIEAWCISFNSSRLFSLFTLFSDQKLIFRVKIPLKLDSHDFEVAFSISEGHKKS